MCRVVEGAFAALGFDCQWRNGPREGTGSAHEGKTRLSFGDKGDDLGAFFLTAPALEKDNCVGYVLATELKRSNASKKAVGQAITFAGRVRKFSEERGLTVRVLPIVVSGGECYSDKLAKDYAYDNGVLHLPLRALRELLELQHQRFHSPQTLITPPHLLNVLYQFHESATFEPTTKDYLAEIKGLLASNARKASYET